MKRLGNGRVAFDFETEWHPASGHSGGWRLVKGHRQFVEYRSVRNVVVLFRSYEAAEARAIKRNIAEGKPAP